MQGWMEGRGKEERERSRVGKEKSNKDTWEIRREKYGVKETEWVSLPVK